LRQPVLYAADTYQKPAWPGFSVASRKGSHFLIGSDSFADGSRHAWKQNPLGSDRRCPDQPPAPDNLIMLGDFNIFNRTDVTMQAITQAGFVVPEELSSIPGLNVDKNQHYD
jgi:hypothetical protein